MTLNNLRFFTEIVKDMNLGVTAKRLFTTQQGLSGHIRRLETHFGVRLFERTPFLVLTKEGEELLREARLILESESRLFASFGTGPKSKSGTLRIACSNARSRFYMPDILSEFTPKYPSVSVLFVDENAYRGQQIFEESDVDIVIGRTPPPSNGLKTIPLSSIKGYIIISDSLLRKHTANADEFIEKSKNGVEISEFPDSIPIAHTGIAGRETWLSEMIPELKNRPKVNIAPESIDILLKICREGKVMLFASETYVKYILKTYSPSFYENIHFFPHNLGNERLSFEEVLAYDSSKFHPQYFEDFIKIALEVFENLKERDSEI